MKNEPENRRNGEAETSAASPSLRLSVSPSHRYALVVIGTSTGGLAALRILLGQLPRAFPLPVVVVQHRVPDTGDGLAEMLGRASALPVCEPLDKQPLEAVRVYLAPAGYHLLVEDGHFALSTEPPVRSARPAVDMLFESAADVFGAGVIAVVLTGANTDGAQGAAAVKARGGGVLVQDPATAEARAMPDAALAAAKVDQVLPVKQIAAQLAELVKTQVNPGGAA